MEDTRITFKTANLAKEKGFVQNPYEIPYSYRYEFTDNTGCVLSYSLFNPSSNICTAQTQSLLAKWLREEHNLYVYPILQYPYYGYEIRKIQDDDKLLKEEIQIGDKFEEAYEIGLQEALKLI